jgi:hypothetical protein
MVVAAATEVVAAIKVVVAIKVVADINASPSLSRKLASWFSAIVARD